MPWTISAILLSPVIVLTLFPAMSRLVRWLGTGATFAVVTLAVLLFDYACTSAPGGGGVTSLMQLNESISGYFGFPLLTGVVLSIWAFALGTFRNRHPSVPIFTWFACASVAVLIGRAWLPWPNVFLAAAPFGATCLVVHAISGVGLFAPAVRVLRLLGRHSLLVFVLHRIVMHALLILVHGLSAAPLAVMLCGATFVLLVAACLVIQRRDIEFGRFRFWGAGERLFAGAAAR
jgi:hypothetical protein